jgi:hypothetical protein
MGFSHDQCEYVLTTVTPLIPKPEAKPICKSQSDAWNGAHRSGEARKDSPDTRGFLYSAFAFLISDFNNGTVINFEK